MKTKTDIQIFCDELQKLDDDSNLGDLSFAIRKFIAEFEYISPKDLASLVFEHYDNAVNQALDNRISLNHILNNMVVKK